MRDAEESKFNFVKQYCDLSQHTVHLECQTQASTLLSL